GMPIPSRLAPYSTPAARTPFPLRAHDDDLPHFHEISEEGRAAVAETLWKAENVELTTVGIDIGSSTSHLMFSRVHLQRKTQLLSSQFVVVSRAVLWRSPIVFTPFLPDFTIDAAWLRAFVEESYAAAGLSARDIDSGAVILTGEAIKRTNAQAIAQIVAADAGKFVCASAGHHLECLLAAHGAGAVAMSQRTHRTILNVDIGGGTTKLALIKNGEILGTCALAVGGRLIAQDEDGRLERVEASALHAARALGIDLRLGERPDPAAVERLVEVFSEIVIATILQQAPAGLAKELLLTDPLAGDEKPHLVTFTGGVSEYIFGRESATFGDIAQPLAGRIVDAFRAGRIGAELLDPGQGIRATVIGASQFSVQVSGTTIHLSEGVELPVRNVPVVFPALATQGDFEAGKVAGAVRAALERIDADDSRPIALAIRWHGDPHHHRMRALAEGIRQAVGAGGGLPLILMVDGDIGRLLGHILEHELHLGRHVISIDGIQLREFDYVDIGEVMRPTNAVPVVIKSLLFPGGHRSHNHDHHDHDHRP
ncbi:MAG: ethanolamine ammonia-lyase reactivating factor EutA, partial [Burkholderiales bacterium]